MQFSSNFSDPLVCHCGHRVQTTTVGTERKVSSYTFLCVKKQFLQHDSLQRSYLMCDVIPGHIQSIAISDYFFLKQLTENVQVLNIRNND